jgi:hypothetical protein
MCSSIFEMYVEASICLTFAELFGHGCLFPFRGSKKKKDTK